MGEVESIYKLLGRFIPFCASLVWMLMLFVSPGSNRTREERQFKYLSVLFFALFALTALLSMFDNWDFASVLIPVVIIWIPVVGYRLVWHITDSGKEDTFRYLKYYILPLTYVVASIVGELLNLTSLWKPLALLFVLSYLSLSLFRIRQYLRALDADIRETTEAKRWSRFVIQIALTTSLAPCITLFPQNTLVLFGVYLVFAFAFILVCSYLCYCSLFLHDATIRPHLIERQSESTDQEPETPKRKNRRIAKVTKNKKGKTVMEPLTRRRFEKYIKTSKPYLDENLKMTDLEQTLCASRTAISNLVNQTYKMNFSRYINHLRIKEVERLKQLPSSSRYTPTELIRKAGFKSMLKYNRAVAIENGDAQNEEQEL